MQVLVQAWLCAVVVSGVLWYAYQFLYKMPMQEVKQMASTAVHVAEAGATIAHKTVHAASAVAHGVASTAGVETSLPSPEEVLGLQGSGESGKKGLALGKGLGLGLFKKGGQKVTAAGKAAGKGLKEAALLLLPQSGSSSSGAGGASGMSDEDQKAAVAVAAAARLGAGLLLLAAASRAVDEASSSSGRHKGSRCMRGRPGFGSSSRGRGAAGHSSSKGAVNAVAATAGAAWKVVRGVVGLPGAVLGWRRNRKSSKRWWEHSSMDAVYADVPGSSAAGVGGRAPAGVLGYGDEEGFEWGSGAGGMLAGDAVLAAADVGAGSSSSSTGNVLAAASPGGKKNGGAGGGKGAGFDGYNGGYDADDGVYLQQYKMLMMRQPSWR
jgi:hypothetical protein